MLLLYDTPFPWNLKKSLEPLAENPKVMRWQLPVRLLDDNYFRRYWQGRCHMYEVSYPARMQHMPSFGVL